MAFLTDEKTGSRAYALIQSELKMARSNLDERCAELKKARKHVDELIATCDRLTTKIAELERDQSALDRGYIALMCDAATAAVTMERR